MARLTEGLPLTEQLMSWFLGPSSIRATSLSRTTRSSAVFLMIIEANCSGSVSRPTVLSGTWITCPSGTGGWPIIPVATWAFCLRMAEATSEAVMSRAASLSGSTQIRML